MKAEFIDHRGYGRLILIFAGWAMDARPFAGLRRDGYDIAVVWDYTSPAVDWRFADGYREICIVAWSLGVAVANPSTGITAPVDDRVTLRLAVNGTTTPIDDRLGIPRALFEATAANLTETSLLKFYRRTAGRALAADFLAKRPLRPLDDVAAELEVFLHSGTYGAAASGYDRAVVGRNDAIFPPDNQLRAWIGTPADVTDDAHLPDFQRILDKYIRDKEHTAERFAAGAASYDANASVQKAVVDNLLDLACHEGAFTRPGKILEVGCGTGVLSRRLSRLPNLGWSLEMWDLAPADGLEQLGTVLAGDAEIMVRRLEPSSYRLIISSSTLQWLNSPAAFLRRCADALAPGGMLLASTFGPDNMLEISGSTGLGLPAMPAHLWRSALISGLSVVKVVEEKITLRFAEPLDIFRHLKNTGVNSLGKSDPSSLRRAMASMTPGDDGLYPLTYHPIYLAFRADNHS